MRFVTLTEVSPHLDVTFPEKPVVQHPVSHDSHRLGSVSEMRFPIGSDKVLLRADLESLPYRAVSNAPSYDTNNINRMPIVSVLPWYH